jgi:hypothetical protein
MYAQAVPQESGGAQQAKLADGLAGKGERIGGGEVVMGGVDEAGVMEDIGGEGGWRDRPTDGGCQLLGRREKAGGLRMEGRVEWRRRINILLITGCWLSERVRAGNLLYEKRGR